MTLTKNQIVEKIRVQQKLSKSKSADIVEKLLEIMKKTMENGNDVMISGFGKFCVKTKNERRGRNPATGHEMMLTRRRVVTFKCSGQLRDKINEHTDG